MNSSYLPAGIVFESSYILCLRVVPFALEMRMDLLLLPDHPAYLAPRQQERGCFRKGLVRISNFTKFEWEATGFAPARDANGEIDWGSLDVFEGRNEHWHLAGDWGVIEIDGGSLSIDWENEPTGQPKEQ